MSAAGLPRTPLVIEPSGRGFRLDARELWRHRELLYLLVWRDVKLRYNQTAIGAAWVLLQPLLTLTIMTVIFGRFAGLPSEGMPYPVFVLGGLLPWLYFSQAMTVSTMSLVTDQGLLTKVYFPRLLIPLARVVRPLLDLALAFVLLLILMAWFGIAPSWRLMALPGVVGLTLLAALGVGLWLAPLNARYRDVSNLLPVILQLGLFASPIVYPLSLVPPAWRPLYGLNPMAGLIDAFRWAIVGHATVDAGVIGLAVLVTGVLMAGGLVFFKHQERTLADVI
jgi:lipopolysaccharide transport system permease protein